ncbi:hypothetical protein V8G54_026538, partial [Vigna mungo]
MYLKHTSVLILIFSPLSEKRCSAYTASPSSEKTLTMRTTFPKYVVALATIVGPVIFGIKAITYNNDSGNALHLMSQIFGGVGITCLPLGLIFSFIQRSKAVITRSQYIK